MATRYGALTLQLKNLSDLSNIGGTFTNIFSATGKQVMSASGNGSFSFKRNAALMSALSSNDGQVAYVYITDQVAGGAAMDVASFIIDKRQITTSNNGADITVSGADILDQLTFTNAGDGAIDNGSGGASSTDIEDIMAFAAAGWSYTTTGTGSGTRSSTGSYHATRGDNVLQLLIATANRSGDIFRQASYSAPTKAIDWRATPDSSGVTLRMPASPTDYDGSTTTGIIISLSEEIDVAERITGIRPYGAGVGDGRLDITGISSANTGGDPSGYTTTFASNVIVNTTLETALGYQKRIDKDFSEITANDPANSTQLTAAAVDLWREAINYLQERDGAKKFYRIRCNVAADLRPGQTVSVIYTEREGGISGGSTVWSINDTFTIHEVTNTVGNDGIRWTDLIVGDTVKKRVTPERLSANVAKAAQGTTRKTDIRTSPGAVSTGLTINTTQPIRIDGTSAGDLSSNRTLSINGLSTVGSANQIPGANAAGTAWEYKTVSGGTGITIGHAANSITVTNSSPASALSGLPFVTIGNTGSLSAERALTTGDGLDLTDGGANSTVTLAVDVTDLIGTGLVEEATNNIAVDFTVVAAQTDLHNRSHSITSASDHTVTGAALDVVGLTATNTLGILTPSAAVSTAVSALLKTDGNGRFRVQGLGIGTAASGNHLLLGSGNQIGIGASPTYDIDIQRSTNGVLRTRISNSSTGTGALSDVYIISDNGAGGVNGVALQSFGASYSGTWSGYSLADYARLVTDSNVNGFIITTSGSTPLRIGTNNVERITVSSAGETTFYGSALISTSGDQTNRFLMGNSNVSGASVFYDFDQTDRDGGSTGAFNLGFYRDANNITQARMSKEIFEIVIRDGGTYYFPLEVRGNQVILAELPTSNPGIPGALYRSGGTVLVST